MLSKLPRLFFNLNLYIVVSFGIWLIYNHDLRKSELFRFGGNGLRYACRCAPSQFFRRINAKIPWPDSPRMNVTGWQNISFDPADMHIFQVNGVYIQAMKAPLRIGKGIWVAPNAGIITTNHDFRALDRHAPGKAVVIGDDCWIGMNSVILPGVVLGSSTLVGAGSIVTKSFPEGNCVIAGNPAHIIRRLDTDDTSDNVHEQSSSN